MTLIPDNLPEARDLKDGLQRLCEHLRPIGVRDLVYGFMLRDRSFIRNDLIFIVTLPDDLMAYYYQDGGLNADPMADQMAAMVAPSPMHLKDAAQRVTDEGVFNFSFAPQAIARGYGEILTCPVGDNEGMGIGGMTHYQNHVSGSPQIDPDIAWAATIAFHKCMKAHGQLGAHFKLTHAEITALDAMTLGYSAEDHAQTIGVTQRTVEKRLQAARRKLMAKTTVEAVYKAIAYGVLPRS